MIVAGFGFRAKATVESLASAFAHAGGQADVFATAQDKARANVFTRFAAGRRVAEIPSEALAAQVTVTQSAASQAARGTGSVAEAAALAAAGPCARLIVARVVSDDGCATCALAKGATP
ncbi:MAG: cobalamin biosynthesis protein [Paracoccus sp. (in: a-proteobacteria)]|nr:cobalamin biosynthesis protein [Paracoccus sp. (in: a-proteobacteria)]